MDDKAIILLVEDLEDDAFMIRQALASAFVSHSIHVVPDGEEAIAYLKGEGEYRDRATHPLPNLILLDLKLPKMHGFEVLRWIRRSPRCKTLRVVVLTNSLDTRDANTAYALGANSFLTKPADFRDGVRLMRVLAGQWLSGGTALPAPSLP